MFRDALVDAFVAAADQQQFGVPGEPVGHRLVEHAALGGEQGYFLIGAAFRPDGFHGVEDRLGLEDHAFAASERPVVDGFVAVVGPVPEVVDADVQDARIFRPFDHAEVERPREKFGEDRQDVENHGRFRSLSPSGNSTAIRRFAGSISTQMWRANGISRSPTTSRPEAPPSSHAETRPSDCPVARSSTSQPMRSSSKNSPSSSGARSEKGTRTSAPLSRSASEMESTPRNFRMRMPSWNQDDSTSCFSPAEGKPSPKRYTSCSAS